MDMARHCLKNKQPFGVVLRKPEANENDTTGIEMVGTSARIIAADMNQPGILQIASRGEQRFTVRSSAREANGLLIAAIDWLDATPALPLAPQYAACAVLLASIIEDLEPDQSAALSINSRFTKPFKLSDTAWVADRLIEVLPVPIKAKQKLLEMTDPQARIELVFAYLSQKGIVPSS